MRCWYLDSTRCFGHFRAKLGAPTQLDDRLGRALAERKSFLPVELPHWPDSVLVVVDGSIDAEPALIAGASAAALFSCPAGVCCVSHDSIPAYLSSIQRAFQFSTAAITVESVAAATALITASGTGLIVSAHGLPGLKTLSRIATAPLLIVSARSPSEARYPSMRRIVAGLDGSPEAEGILPYLVRLLDLGANVQLMLVPDGDLSADSLRNYADTLTPALRPHGDVAIRIEGSGPARTLVERAREISADLVLVGSHGRGGFQRVAEVPLGSVPERLIADLNCSLLVIPLNRDAPDTQAMKGRSSR